MATTPTIFSWRPNTRFIFNPRINIGYRFRFLDFHEQSGSGFFDPSNYIANRVFTSYWLERDKYYTYVEGSFGYETFRRNRVASDNFIYGGSGSIGYKPISTLAIEFNAEGGTFSAGSTSGQLLRYRTESSVQILVSRTSPAE